MGLREDVIDALQSQGPLDDDELATLLGRNRHYVNNVCRALARANLVTRAPGPGGKLVTELLSDGDAVGAARPDRAPGPRRLPRHERARQNIENLLQEFDESVRRFETANNFGGPSLYFHERAIERRRHASTIAQLLADRRFFEYVYAVLPAWGMHRMGPQAAKVGDFQTMWDSFARHAEHLRELAELRITHVAHTERQAIAEKVWRIISDLDVSTSKTRIVAGSKALHHVLPDLVPPIDRQYTFQFFAGQKSVHFGEERAFLEWFPLLCEIGERGKSGVDAAIERGGFMATGEAKIIDNAIMGFAQRSM